MDSYVKFIDKLNACGFNRRTSEVPINISDSERCLLNAVILSDLHISQSVSQSKIQQTENVFHCINDISQSSSRIDVLTFAGDLTDNGKENEYRYLAENLCELNTVEHIVPVTGNHDIRFGPFKNTLKNFAGFCSSVNNRLSVPGLWYSYKVNGFTFIVLGSVKRRFEEASISKDELIWLDKKLTKTDEEGKPAFVMLHQPLKFTHNLPNSWDMPGAKAGSVGKESDMLSFVLGMHKNVFLITGHLHRGFNKFTYEESNGIHCISVPSAGLYNKDSDYSNPGLGFTMEIYENEVKFRPRDFINGRYIPKHEKTYKITQKTPAAL